MVETILLHSLDTIEIKKATFQQKTFPMHFHDTYSIGLITKGIESISFQDNDLIFYTDTFVIFNPYELHANSFYDEDEWGYCTINYNMDFLRFIAQKYKITIHEPLRFEHTFRDDCLKIMLKSIDSTEYFHRIAVLENIACYLLQHYQKHRTDWNITPSKYSSWHDMVEEIKANITTNYHEKLTLDNLALKYKKSPYQIIRAFKWCVGLSPTDYQIVHRINKAKKLIRSEENITQVALECGFFDHSHFTHYFNKFLGITPSQYKKNIIQLSA